MLPAALIPEAETQSMTAEQSCAENLNCLRAFGAPPSEILLLIFWRYCARWSSRWFAFHLYVARTPCVHNSSTQAGGSNFSFSRASPGHPRPLYEGAWALVSLQGILCFMALHGPLASVGLSQPCVVRRRP
ncbi:hypothetical protein TRVL_08000 [Trypanosoma vivax]|nr:hypothetical protein TRVL_08000 [Trypanosoma vivax]